MKLLNSNFTYPSTTENISHIGITPDKQNKKDDIDRIMINL